MNVITIGRAARDSGLSPRMIRHYERLGLLETAPRSEGGYRKYGERDVQTLRFVRQARDLGFSLEQTQALLGLWRDQGRPARQVKSLAMRQLAALEAKQAELQSMKSTLEHLVHACQGDQEPACPILDSLAAGRTAEGTGDTAPTRRSKGEGRRDGDLTGDGGRP